MSADQITLIFIPKGGTDSQNQCFQIRVRMISFKFLDFSKELRKLYQWYQKWWKMNMLVVMIIIRVQKEGIMKVVIAEKNIINCNNHKRQRIWIITPKQKKSLYSEESSLAPFLRISLIMMKVIRNLLTIITRKWRMKIKINI